MEQAKGTADMQSQLAKSRVNVDIFTNQANARKAEADGEATYIRETGKAKGAEVEAVGLARAKAYEQQVKALGQTPTALVNSINALAEKGIKIVPEILVAGGGGAIDGLAATLTGWLQRGPGGSAVSAAPPTAETPAAPLPSETPAAVSVPTPPPVPPEEAPPPA